MTHWWNATARIFRLSWTRRVSALRVWALGGLGSNLAIFLARLGVGHLILVDFDVVDITNLNRQHYTMKDLGIPKTLALVEQLEAINPYLTYETYTERVVPSNVERLFSGCDVVVEAFDKPDQKAMLLENLLTRLPEKPVVSGSGMAGYVTANLDQDRKTLRPCVPLRRRYKRCSRRSRSDGAARSGLLGTRRHDGAAPAHWRNGAVNRKWRTEAAVFHSPLSIILSADRNHQCVHI